LFSKERNIVVTRDLLSYPNGYNCVQLDTEEESQIRQ